MALSWSAMWLKGPRAPEREPALVRAQMLCEQLRDNTELMEALVALAISCYGRSDFERARELAGRVLVTAQHLDSPAIVAGAHAVLGVVGFSTGQFQTARVHFEQAVALFDADPARIRFYGAYLAINASNILVGVLLILGYPLGARSRANMLLTTARRSSDPPSIAVALFSYGMHHIVLRDTGMVAERADELFSIAAEHEIAMSLIAATFLRGWAAAAAGRTEEGIAEMRRAVSDPMTAELVSTSLMLAALPETCGKHGQAGEGLDWVAKGLATA